MIDKISEISAQEPNLFPIQSKNIEPGFNSEHISSEAAGYFFESQTAS